MSQFQFPAGNPRARRLLAVVSVIGAACLAGPISVAAQTPAPQHHAHKSAAQKQETLDARITALHAQLQITPDQEVKWAAVAQVMRDNQAEMQTMVADRRVKSPTGGDAVDELKTYERFSQAHVNGLKNLISSFEALYTTMPAAQQAVADHVFKHFGRGQRS
jgi:hypothetical protein